eukprot:jgi/Psemu1/18326/gm1.18326_g
MLEFPIFVRDTEDMEASASGPDIQLAQSWESPSTISSKATWDSQSHENPCFAKSQEEESPPPPPKGLEKILFQQSDAKTQSSDDTSWNSPLVNANSSPPSSPATATIDQLWSVEGAAITAEKKEHN